MHIHTVTHVPTAVPTRVPVGNGSRDPGSVRGEVGCSDVGVGEATIWNKNLK